MQKVRRQLGPRQLGNIILVTAPNILAHWYRMPLAQVYSLATIRLVPKCFRQVVEGPFVSDPLQTERLAQTEAKTSKD